MQNYFEYEHQMTAIAQAIGPLLDAPPVELSALGSGSLRERLAMWPAIKAALKSGMLWRLE